MIAAALVVALLGFGGVAQGQVTWSYNGTQNIYNANTGNVGIGTQNPTQKLQLGVGNIMLPTGNYSTAGSLYFGGATEQGQVGLRLFGGLVNGAFPAGFIDVMTTDATDGLRFRVDTIGGGTERMRIAASGVVTIYGDLSVGGNIAAKYQDLAEWVPARERMSAGTVVVLDEDAPNSVTASKRSYDTKVAGVVSKKPGVALGEPGKEKVLIATTGRVKVRADASCGPIRIGDLLVTSDHEGVAMRSEPLNVSGVPIHRPGTLIGKALESLEQGEGEILVLLSLQ